MGRGRPGRSWWRCELGHVIVVLLQLLVKEDVVALVVSGQGGWAEDETSMAVWGGGGRGAPRLCGCGVPLWIRIQSGGECDS